MQEPVVHSVDIEELISYCNDLVKLVRDRKDVKGLTEAQEGASLLQSSSYNEFTDLQSRIQDCKSKINARKQEIDEINKKSDSEFAKELEEELQMEKDLLNELRMVSEEIECLERQRVSIEELEETLKKMAKEKIRTQQLLSMYASVTTIIPDLKDGSHFSGQIVDRDKKRIEKFDFDPMRTSNYETCNSLWKMIDS